MKRNDRPLQKRILPKAFLWLDSVLLGLISSFAFCYRGTPAGDTALEYLLDSIPEAGMMGTFCFLVLTALYYQRLKEGVPVFRLSAAILGVLFSIAMLVGLSMNLHGNLCLLWGRAVEIPIALVVIGGWFCMFYFVLELLLELAEANVQRPLNPPGKFPALERFAGGRGLRPVLTALLICWLPYLLVYFPASLSWDGINQLNMFFGEDLWSNAHPPLSVALIGSCVALGRLVGSDNLGLFLYALLQSFVLALAFAETLKTMTQLKISIWVRTLTMLFYALVPIWGMYAQWAVKDTLYTAAVQLFTCRIVQFSRTAGRGNPEPGRGGSAVPGGRIPKSELLQVCLFGLPVCLLRNNGILLVTATFLALLIMVKGRRSKLVCGSGFAAVLTLFLCFSGVILPVLGIGGSSPSELLSVPLQQTARVVREHGDSIPADIEAAIEAVLDDGDMTVLGQVYTPRLADPVKGAFDNNCTPEERNGFLLAWLRLMFRHPGTCLDAFAANTYAYFCPDADRTDLLLYCTEIESNPAVNTGFFDLHYADESGVLRHALGGIVRALARFPVIWLFFSQGFYGWLLAAVFTFALVRRRGCWIPAMMPSLATFLMCLLSAVNGEFRYLLPVMAAAPLLLALVLRKQAAEERDAA
ncbi:MAG: hypothetical protein IJC68_02560 [Firmicutes bacterium]|nr:hypothetical protein [Bacillota bacterium]